MMGWGNVLRDCGVWAEEGGGRLPLVGRLVLGTCCSGGLWAARVGFRSGLPGPVGAEAEVRLWALERVWVWGVV